MTATHDPLCPPFNGHLPRERCKICDLIARVREDERDGWGSSDKWRHVQRVQREVRHHIAGLLATEPADRLREADGAEFILLADAQRIARGGAR